MFSALEKGEKGGGTITCEHIDISDSKNSKRTLNSLSLSLSLSGLQNVLYAVA